MKKSLCTILAGTAVIFTACGDDSSSNSSTDELTIQNSGTITIDPQNRTIVTTFENNEEMCVNENLGYTWKEVYLGDITSYSKYDFKNDTLIIYKGCNSLFSSCDDDGQMLVGGKAGSLDGTWKTVPCQYDPYYKTSECYTPCSEVPGGKLTDDDAQALYESGKISSWSDLEENPTLLARLTCLDEKEMNRFPQTTIKISGSSVTTSVSYTSDTEAEFSDYTNSKFMTQLMKYLQNGEVDVPNTNFLFKEDSSDMSALVAKFKKNGIDLVSQTTNSISFKYGNETFSFWFNNVSYNNNGFELSMELSSGQKSCTLQEEMGIVTQKTCKAEYGEFYEKDTEKDAYGNRITVAEEYSKSNEKDFEKCAEDLLESIFDKGTPANTDMDEEACTKLAEEYFLCYLTSSSDISCLDIEEEYTQKCIDNNGYYGTIYSTGAFSKAIKAKSAFLKNTRKFARHMQRATM